MQTTPQPPRAIGRLLKLRDVQSETSLSPAVIYRRMKDGTFPASRPLGGGRVAWLEAEIEAWKVRVLSGDFADTT